MFKRKKHKLRLALPSNEVSSSSGSSGHSSPLSSLRQYFSPREEIPMKPMKRVDIDFAIFCEFTCQLLSRQDTQGLTEVLDMVFLNHKDINYDVLWDYIYDIRELAYLQRNVALEKALQDFEKTLKAERNRKRDNALWSIIREDEVSQKEGFDLLHKERMRELYLKDLT